MIARPDFDKFEISSIAARKRWSNGFLLLCTITSTFSIVILVVLISTIVISALPVFGPHSDRLETQSRMLFTPADASTGSSDLEAGDLVQGVFRGEQLVRGGLGKTNDESLIAAAGEPAKPLVLGFYAYQLADAQDPTIRPLTQARGAQSIRALLERLGLAIPDQAQDAALVVLSSPTGGLDFESLETDGALVNDKLVDQLAAVDDWSIRLLAGPQTEQDFAEIRFTDSNHGDLELLRKTRVRKRAGQLKILNSILYDREHAAGTYQEVRLRTYSNNEIASSHLKVDVAELDGLSRRSRLGFDLGGVFPIEWCQVPEPQASTTQHIAHFLKEKPSSSDPAAAGIGPALWGSIWACTFCGLVALPLGIGTAVFLEEFKPTGKFLRFLQSLVQLNITNLAGVPSIVYGILGLTAFATMFGLFGSDKQPNFRFGGVYYYQYLSEDMNPILVPVDGADQVPTLVDGMAAQDGDHNPITLRVIGPDQQMPTEPAERQWALRSDSQGGVVSDKPWYYFQIPFGRGVLAAALTLMLVILPVIIIASQEAIKAVPSSLREGAMGVGATRWQVVRNVTLPAAIPGIMTGAILSISGRSAKRPRWSCSAAWFTSPKPPST